jgi:ecotin
MKGLFLLTALGLSFPLTAAAAGNDYGMKPYPVPRTGQQRLAFRVPAVENEENHRIEILAGTSMDLGCNRTWFGGDLEQRTAKGWGFPYYVLNQVGPAASTRMACPPGEEKTQTFVQVRGDGFFQRYNSKLPVVVYVPEGFEVRYRIWSAGSRTGSAVPE